MTRAGTLGRLLSLLVLVGAVFAAPVHARPTPRGCAAAQLLDARGTGEPGALGIVVGDPLLRDLRALRPGLSAYRVNYPASTASTSPGAGDRDLVGHLRKQAAKCPHEQFVLAGYSQGANVVEMALGVDTSKALVGGPSVARIPRRLSSRVVAILLFGSPLARIGGSVPTAYRGRTLDTCNPGDDICDPTSTEFPKHLQYLPLLEPAASFAARRIRRH